MPFGIYSRPSSIERFCKYLSVLESGCWLWTGTKDGCGYGLLRTNGKLVLAHRFSYEWFNGVIPSELTLDHLCRNRACVNPEHLEAVTLEENLSRGVGFGAINHDKNYCPHGHPYNAQNTYYTKNGWRLCRVCDLLRKRQKIPKETIKQDNLL